MKIKDPNPPSYQYIYKPQPKNKKEIYSNRKYNFPYYNDIKNFLFPFLRK